VAMDRWVTKGDLPPDNQIPKVSDGTLVCPDQESTGFPFHFELIISTTSTPQVRCFSLEK